MQQTLAGFEVELASERACDRSGASCADGFLRGPEGFGLVRGFHQDQARRIEAELVEAVTMGVSAAVELFRGEHEQEGRASRHAGEERQEEAEGGGQVGFVCGCDLVHGAEGEAAVREMVLQLGQAELQAAFLSDRDAFEAREVSAQAGHDLGASGALLGRVGRHSRLFSAQNR